MASDKKSAGIGKGTPGPGRPKGTPNRATVEFRETIKALLEQNADNVSVWLEQVATGSHGKDPAPEKALDLLAKLAEFAAPKLSRSEVVGDANAPMAHRIEFAIVDNAKG